MTAVVVDPFVPGRAPAGDLAAWAEVFAAGQGAASGGSVDAVALAARLRAEDDPAVCRWSARRGTVVGVAELHTRPERVGFLRLFVPPDARREGIGTALLDHVIRTAAGNDLARLQATVAAGAPGEPFARRRPGLQVVLRLETQRQRLDDAVLRRCRKLAAGPHPGYRLAHWRGAAPDELAASFGRVLGHVLDAPGAMFQMAPRAWDPPKVRTWETGLTAGGEHLLVCAAVDRASGGVVAATVLTATGAAAVADQQDTAVLPGHRGRGLARWIKAAQVLTLTADLPGVTAVAATVNRRNGPMLAVNRALGYQPLHERLLVSAPL